MSALFDASSWFGYFMLGNLAFLLMLATSDFPRFRVVAKWTGLLLYALTTVLLFVVSHDPGAPWFLLMTFIIALLSTVLGRWTIGRLLKPITDALVEVIEVAIVKAVLIAIPLITIGVGLVCIYGLVRFVRWAWYN